MDPFVGTEAIANGSVNRYQLAARYRAIHRNVYVLKDQQLTPVQKAVAAWMWSRRQATVAGVSAAALHGSEWIDARLPAELNQASQHKTPGIVLRCEKLSEHEISSIQGIAVTTPARTAFDLGRRYGRTLAVVRLDALTRATGLMASDVGALIERHPGVRGLVQLRDVLPLIDGGAESPQETRLRLVFVDAELPPPTTQLEVWDGRYFIARIDMGWECWKVGVEYDGIQHWTDAGQRTRDIDRLAELEAMGWRIVRVSADMLRHRQRTVVNRVSAALRAAGCPI